MDSIICCHPKDYEAVAAGDLTETYRGEEEEDDYDLEQDDAITATPTTPTSSQRHPLEVAALSVLRWYPPTLNYPPPPPPLPTQTNKRRCWQATRTCVSSSSSSSNSSSLVEEEDPAVTLQRQTQRQSVQRLIAVCVFLLCLFGISLGISIVIRQHLGQRHGGNHQKDAGMVVPSSPPPTNTTTTTTTTNATPTTAGTNRTTPTTPAAPIWVDYPPEVVDGGDDGGGERSVWITAPLAAAASHVTIPRPPPPPSPLGNDEDTTTTTTTIEEPPACPHLQENLVDWRSIVVVDAENDSNDDITLPENTKVILRHNVTLGKDAILTIPSNTVLIVADDNDDTTTTTTDSVLTLTVGGMMVRGAFIMGSESCPYQGHFTLTLTGSRPTTTTATATINHNHHKGIVVSSGGRLDWHGPSYTPTWTRYVVGLCLRLLCFCFCFYCLWDFHCCCCCCCC